MYKLQTLNSLYSNRKLNRPEDEVWNIWKQTYLLEMFSVLLMWFVVVCRHIIRLLYIMSIGRKRKKEKNVIFMGKKLVCF